MTTKFKEKGDLIFKILELEGYGKAFDTERQERILSTGLNTMSVKELEGRLLFLQKH